MDTRSVKKTMAIDTALYLPARVIEGILGLILLKVSTTWLFDTEVYAGFTYGTTLVNITNLIVMGWISQSATRYVSKYQDSGEESDFFKTITAAWAVLSFGIIAIAAILLTVFRNSVPIEIYRLYIFMFAGYNMVQILLPLLAFMRRIRLNLLLSVGSNLFKLLFTLLLVVILKNNDRTPAAALIGYGITDLLIACIIVWKLNFFRHIKLGRVSKEILKTLFSFSLPFLGVNITTALLNLSDRLIIKPLAGEGQLGIYSANYAIPSMVFLMITTGVLRGIYPILLKSYRKDEPKQAAELLSQALRYFLLLALPAVCGLIILSDSISRIFIGADFFEGGFVISFVAAGVFCSSFVEFSNKAFEMSANTKPIFRYALISTLLNLGLNIIFIPMYGYRTAAVSTFLSFFLYLCLSVVGSRKQIHWYIRGSSLIKMVLSCLAMLICIYGLKQLLSDNLLSVGILVAAGTGVYGLVLFLSGEMKEVAKLFQKSGQ